MMKKGYIFTLSISLMALITLSLILYYTQISTPSFTDKSNKMNLDELHFFVESLKEDLSRAESISGQRSTAYAIDHIITTNETFEDYEMANCTQFKYPTTGVEAAIAELIVCGTLKNTQKPAQDIEKYMENNTLMDWIEKVSANRISGMPYNVTVKFKSIDIALYDSWDYIIFTEIDLIVKDTTSDNQFVGQSIPVTSIIEVTTFEDPMHYIIWDGKISTQIRTFKKCANKAIVNGSILDDWIETGCYLPGKNHNQGPSFFDRLEGSTELDGKFIERSNQLFEGSDYVSKDISLESLIDIKELNKYNVSVNANLSQVDYSFWNNMETNCKVDGMDENPGFRIDPTHAIEYRVRGLNCDVTLSNTSAENYFFTPANMIVPPNTKINWVDKTGYFHNLIILPGPTQLTILPNGNTQQEFTQEGQYFVECEGTNAAFTLTVTDTSQ